ACARAPPALIGRAQVGLTDQACRRWPRNCTEHDHSPSARSKSSFPPQPGFRMPDASHSTDSYRRDIDGLRAIAVLFVLAFHPAPAWLRGGFIGVDIFFVISGYLITGLILRDLHQGRFRFRDFYERRIRRIFPALVVVLAASFGLGWVLLTADELASLGK